MDLHAPPTLTPVSRRQALLEAARDARQLRLLPPPARSFHARAILTALRLRDWRSFHSSAPPRDVAALIDALRGRREVAEIGTASAWTALALALAEPGRRVLSVDVVVRPHRHRYVGLVPPDVARRVTLEQRSGADPPPREAPVEALFVDADKRAEAVAAFVDAWRPLLAPGAVVAFHDYGHPDFPGIAEGIRLLGLEGEARGRLFVARAG